MSNPENPDLRPCACGAETPGGQCVDPAECAGEGQQVATSSEPETADWGDDDTQIWEL